MMPPYTKYHKFLNSRVGHIKRHSSSCLFATSLSCQGFPVLDNKSRGCCRHRSCPTMISPLTKHSRTISEMHWHYLNMGWNLLFLGVTLSCSWIYVVGSNRSPVDCDLNEPMMSYGVFYDVNLKKTAEQKSSGRLFDTLLRSQYWNVSTQLCSRDGDVIVTVREYIGFFSAIYPYVTCIILKAFSHFW